MSGQQNISEDERRRVQDKVASDDKLTELNIQLNTKHRRYKALLDERKKLNDTIQDDDQKKMVITRNLEKQLLEKEDKIKAYQARLAELD